jgi:hypothetical protein
MLGLAFLASNEEPNQCYLDEWFTRLYFPFVIFTHSSVARESTKRKSARNGGDVGICHYWRNKEARVYYLLPPYQLLKGDIVNINAALRIPAMHKDGDAGLARTGRKGNA